MSISIHQTNTGVHRTSYCIWHRLQQRLFG